ncbi:MAG TPA: BolA/IbaG family iron-sulfur metabolism protein [Gemmatimonadota bacterium]|nr:BolA/IbaG family iron-sulfur metabolism protein [Gemmatimonadota bacterium]
MERIPKIRANPHCVNTLGGGRRARYLVLVTGGHTIRERVAERIRREIPDARVEVVDLTGTDNHLEARVVSSAFEGRSPVERHRMVYAPIRGWLDDDTVHALSVKTWTPEQYRTLATTEE